MKLSKALAIFEHICECVPALAAALTKSPRLLLNPTALKRAVFFKVWSAFGKFIDQNGAEVKRGLVTLYAEGVALDLGAGLGHTAAYLDRSKVTKYIALEPNTLMHDGIKKEVAQYGFTEEAGTLQLLSCGAEETDRIVAEIGGQVDTMIAIRMLCSVPKPQKTIEELMDKVLKPGGQFLFCEHVAHKRWDVRVWQYFWTPIWGIFFDGCVLYRPTDVYIKNLTCWKPLPEVIPEGDRVGTWDEEEEEENLLPHQIGRFIKKD
ncbi:hypothetical protein M422DRAFT_45562 [Sphaerobolus stellatus SS14]|uniref:Methyltransferase type 11 domain-containing protein n=1 Tax=Sphaerobolus stellatus (strain SS14) TaxID=990650 RepID=A0A0C9VVS9_SPHS4|nr:hypothetical protein M422DRAFT_45562 [Sphaerobolus stellatus SS14]